MKKIDIKQADGAEPRDMALAIVNGNTFPFMAKITHRAKKSLVVPSTGLNTVIEPKTETEFKVKSFEQVWVLVTDVAALAARYEDAEDAFASISVPALPAAAAAPSAETTKPEKATTKAADAVAK